MRKFFTAAALALAFCAPDASAASFQKSSVRVGPADDADSSPKREKKDGARAAAKPEQQRERQKEPANTEARQAVQPPAVASSAAAPPASDNPTATSDAPPKPNHPAAVPINTAEKRGRIEAGGDDTSSKPADTPKTAPAPSNTTTSNASTPGATTRPAPPAASAPPLTSIYRIGVGDVLDVRLLNLPDGRQSTLFTVLSGGLLEYPLLPDAVTVAGMTTDELAAQLVAELRHRGVYERPQVRVGVREYASHAVLASGLAGNPGTKILRREAIPLYVVVAEAQPRPEAGLAVVFSHATGKTTNVDLGDAAAMGTLVQQGDVVSLVARPPAFFYAGGEINQPGQKEFHAGMTLTQAVLAAGGATRFSGVRVRVSRQGADGRLVSAEYALKEIEDGLVPDPSIRAGDRVEVSRAKK
jgi:protein involved in polysaccharide export with SLBB domain